MPSRDAFTANGGVEVDTQGDAFFVAFGRASDALAAAAACAVRAGFVPDQAAREICSRLDGLPLALELAVSRLRSLGAVASSVD